MYAHKIGLLALAIITLWVIL